MPMVEQYDLTSAKVFQGLSGGTLEKIKEIKMVRRFSKGEYIFKEREHAEYLYSVIEGKVGLEIKINSQIPFLVKCIYPGKAFGISAVVDTEKRATICHAKALEPSKLFCIQGTHLESLFDLNYEQGYIFLRNVGKMLKTRLEIQRVQLVEGLINERVRSA